MIRKDSNLDDVVNKLPQDSQEKARQLLANHARHIFSLEALTKVADAQSRDTALPYAKWIYHISQSRIDNVLTGLDKIEGLGVQDEKNEIEEARKALVNLNKEVDDFFKDNNELAKQINLNIKKINSKIIDNNKKFKEIPHYQNEFNNIYSAQHLKFSFVADGYEKWKLSPISPFYSITEDKFESKDFKKDFENSLGEVGLSELSKSKSYDFTYNLFEKNNFKKHYFHLSDFESNINPEAQKNKAGVKNNVVSILDKNITFSDKENITKEDLKSLHLPSRISDLIDEYFNKPDEINNAELKEIANSIDKSEINFTKVPEGVQEITDKINIARKKYLKAFQYLARVRYADDGAKAKAKAEAEKAKNEYEDLTQNLDKDVMNIAVFGTNKGLVPNGTEQKQVNIGKDKISHGLSTYALQNLLKSIYVNLRLAFDESDPRLNEKDPRYKTQRKEIYKTLFSVMHLKNNLGFNIPEEWVFILPEVFQEITLDKLKGSWEWVQ